MHLCLAESNRGAHWCEEQHVLDVMEFARTSRPVEVDDLDLEHAFEDAPLSPETLRCLRYLADIESHTVCYLSDLLLT